MEHENIIRLDDSYYCKILKKVIKHDDPFKESKVKQIGRYITSHSRIICYVDYNIVSDILSQDDCWIDNPIFGKRLDRLFFVQQLINISSKKIMTSI
ncbi:MAG: hypothetical protein QWI36_04570 [Wolbachia endosymbiont of Tyrophagus putrescentiae]|nr:hypothetical protein [Wolbachia endosymbiont of Tyrophagus putrescentiae]